MQKTMDQEQNSIIQQFKKERKNAEKRCIPDVFQSSSSMVISCFKYVRVMPFGGIVLIV